MATSEIPTRESLTKHLLSLSTPRPYSAAIEHPFLTDVGRGTLSPALLSFYLAQDRFYTAHAYPHFIGNLITAVPFSTAHAPGSAEDAANQHIVGLLVRALEGVRREVVMFSDVSKKHGFELGKWRERKATRDYTAEMARVGARGRIEEGLVCLWAMERVYLDAWKYVGSLKPSASSDLAGAIVELVQNWTSPEFVRFVDELEDIVNSLKIEPGSEAYVRAEEIWARVIELEEAFWPVAGEDLSVYAK
ncbi:Bifunctional TENA2 protein [Grifola frondosa]|uniref:Bifunctional TENA2 protein n=1 Tax=Grifola frondosa TaxID=5627 RepID=A0A1C7LUA3_GRIFR|nr:Bifunctional TENA2 protein [Grifola frondosa]